MYINSPRAFAIRAVCGALSRSHTRIQVPCSQAMLSSHALKAGARLLQLWEGLLQGNQLLVHVLCFGVLLPEGVAKDRECLHAMRERYSHWEEAGTRKAVRVAAEVSSHMQTLVGRRKEPRSEGEASETMRFLDLPDELVLEVARCLLASNAIQSVLRPPYKLCGW